MPYIVAIIAGISGFLFGYDEGVIAGALSGLRHEFTVSPLLEGCMTAAVPFGALFGSLAGGWLADRYGRRGALILAGILFSAGAAVSSLAWDCTSLTTARLAIGLAIGLAAVAAPLYISENAPARHRGMLVSFYQLAITLGILGAYIAGYGLEGSWRTMFAIGMAPGVVLAAAMTTMHDTPRWLMLRGRTEDAHAALIQNGLAGQANAELQAIRRSIAATPRAARWSALFSRRVLPATIVAVGLFVLQQLSGINAVIYYAPLVFREAGFDSHGAQLLATIGIGVVNVAMTLVSMALIDRIGRRRMLYIGFVGAALSLTVIACAAASDSPWLNAVAFAGLLAYIAAFAISIGPLPWLMMAEIFPIDVRPLGMGLASIANWTFNALVVFAFPALLGGIGLAGVFAGFAIACLVGVAFTWALVPETSGASLEDIEAQLSSGERFRDLARAA
ncbi:sugar porter family MFS transporter [Camelimonas fluminis]|uniref:Sugar porter family MFS transporter n=1 Tax=Camelimonas fluminis TaxID=1576911 RepID=A0ABV7UDK0_9HYPH|nr:sugar porter family MFS transporter [Camelimonas fluminis]